MAMAKVHRPSTDDEGEILAQPSGQQVVGNTYPGRAPVISSALPDAPLDSKPMAGNRMRNSSDVAIPQKDTTGRPMEGVTTSRQYVHQSLSRRPTRHRHQQGHVQCVSL